MCTEMGSVSVVSAATVSTPAPTSIVFNDEGNVQTERSAYDCVRRRIVYYSVHLSE